MPGNGGRGVPGRTLEKRRVIKFMSDDKEEQWITKYDENQCGNCHFCMEEGDQYCRLCGTKRGEGNFEPYKNITKYIYAQELKERKHICQKCGYKWKTIKMEDKEKFCPRCGGLAPIVDESGIIKKKGTRVRRTGWDNPILEIFLPYGLIKTILYLVMINSVMFVIFDPASYIIGGVFSFVISLVILILIS